MSVVKTATVGGIQYNIAQAPAVGQKKLLTLVGKYVSLAFEKDGQIDQAFIVAVLFAIPEETLDRVAAIVLYKTIKNGGDSIVTVDDFQNRITEYYQLIAEGIKANLQDFFDYLARPRAEAAEAKDKAQ